MLNSELLRSALGPAGLGINRDRGHKGVLRGSACTRCPGFIRVCGGAFGESGNSFRRAFFLRECLVLPICCAEKAVRSCIGFPVRYAEYRARGRGWNCRLPGRAAPTGKRKMPWFVPMPIAAAYRILWPQVFAEISGLLGVGESRESVHVTGDSVMFGAYKPL